MSDIILPQSPEEQKPDFRELERARLLERAKQANVEQVSRETIDLRETRTPTATSPPPPDLSASLPTMSTPLPPPPSEIPPPPPIESPVSPPPAMPIVDSPTTVYPPPPLPEAPDFDDILQDNQLLDGTWSTRVHLLTEIVQLSSEIQTIQDDFQAVQKLAEASTMLPEEAQARLGGRLGQAETLLHAKKAEYDRLREEIVSNASGVWPIAKEQMERDVTLLTEYQEMVGYLAGLKRVTSELQEALAVLDIGRMPAIPALTQALREDVEARVQEEAVMPTRQKGGADEGAMDIDGAPPPYQTPAGSTPVLPPSEQTIFQRDFDEISSRLDSIEKDLYAIDDAVWQRENELRDEFMAELERKTLEWYTLMSRGSKIGESGMKRGGEEGGEVEEERVEEEEEEGGDLEEDEEIAALKRELCEMRAQTIEGAKEVDEMTEILENFQTRLVSAEGLLPEANLEYQAALQRNADLHNRLAVLEAADRASTAKLDATHNMVSLQPPSPPSSPAPLPSADILHALRDPLKAELRRAVIPIIEDSRAQMTKEIDEKVNALYGTVFERAEPSVRVLKALERVLTQGGIPVNGFIGASGKEGGAMNGAASH